MSLTSAPNPGDPLSSSGFGADVANSGFLTDAAGAGSVTLSTNSAFASGISATFVLNSTRRVRITVQGRFQQAAATTARFQIRAGYCSGSSAVIGSFVAVGNVFDVCTTIAGVNGMGTGNPEGTALLTAGTYTAFASVTRVTNGSATDTASTFYIAAYDVGNA